MTFADEREGNRREIDAKVRMIRDLGDTWFNLKDDIKPEELGKYLKTYEFDLGYQDRFIVEDTHWHGSLHQEEGHGFQYRAPDEEAGIRSEPTTGCIEMKTKSIFGTSIAYAEGKETITIIIKVRQAELQDQIKHAEAITTRTILQIRLDEIERLLRSLPGEEA